PDALPPGDRRLLRGDPPEGPEPPQLPGLRLRDAQRPARAALRHRGGHGPRLPPRRDPEGPPPRRAAGAVGNPDPDDVRDPDGAGAPRPVGPGVSPRHAPSAAAQGRPRAAGRREGDEDDPRPAGEASRGS